MRNGPVLLSMALATALIAISAAHAQAWRVEVASTAAATVPVHNGGITPLTPHPVSPGERLGPLPTNVFAWLSLQATWSI